MSSEWQEWKANKRREVAQQRLVQLENLLAAVLAFDAEWRDTYDDDAFCRMVGIARDIKRE